MKRRQFVATLIATGLFPSLLRPQQPATALNVKRSEYTGLMPTVSNQWFSVGVDVINGKEYPHIDGAYIKFGV